MQNLIGNSEESLWLQNAVKNIVCVPESEYDAFWIHHSFVPSLSTPYWQSIMQPVLKQSGSYGFLHEGDHEQRNPDILVFIFSSKMLIMDAANIIFDTAQRLKNEERVIPFAEIYSTNGDYEIDLETLFLKQFD